MDISRATASKIGLWLTSKSLRLAILLMCMGTTERAWKLSFSTSNCRRSDRHCNGDASSDERIQQEPGSLKDLSPYLG